MQRHIARFLLLFALVGNFLPLALTSTAAPIHACCLRKAAHHCHDSAGTSQQLVVSGVGCGNHDCCRGVSVSQWASPQSALTVGSVSRTEILIAASRATVPLAEPSSHQSTRAPPFTSIA